MRGSFFTESTSLPMVDSGYESKIPECGQCGFYKTCKSPKIKPQGKGRKKIMIILNSPDKEADSRGEHICGQTRDLLSMILRKHGVDLKQDCIITSSLICKVPEDTKPEKVIGSTKNCRPNLTNLIKEHDPRIIFLMGYLPIKSMLTYFWKPNDIEYNSLVGWTIPVQKLVNNAWVIPTYHPSEISNEKFVIVRKMFQDHIEKGIALLKKDPHPDGLPNYEATALCLYDKKAILDKLNKIMDEKKPTAFDYETNMLKPDSWKSRIECMSVCNGNYSYAFSNIPEIRERWKMFLRSDVPKVGYNAKFETRWSRRIFKVRVNEWIWDGMNNAHILDCRKGITSLKFQSFARFGTLDYDSKVANLLKSKDESSYGENRIKDIPVNDLLKYCSMDSLLERQVWKSQRKELKAKVEKQRG